LNQSDLELEVTRLRKELVDLKEKVRVIDSHQDMVLGYNGERFSKRIKLRGVRVRMRGGSTEFDFKNYGYPSFETPDDYQIVLDSNDGKIAPLQASYKITKKTGSKVLIASTNGNDTNSLNLLITQTPKAR